MGEIRKPVTFNDSNEQDKKRLQLVNELIADKKWGTWVKKQLDFEIQRRALREKVDRGTNQINV